MSLADKARNEAEELKGRTKEFVGDKTDNEQMQAEGAGDQMKANTKQAGEHAKDAASDVADNFR